MAMATVLSRPIMLSSLGWSSSAGSGETGVQTAWKTASPVILAESPGW